MKNIFLGITIAIFLLCGNAFAQTKQSDDEKAIFTLMTNAGKAWEAGDVNKFAEYLTEDCVHVDPSGKQFNGREAYKKHLQWVIENYYSANKPTLEISEFSLRFLSPDVALLTFLSKEEKHLFRESFTVTKVKNVWKIASVQLVAVTEPPMVKPN